MASHLATRRGPDVARGPDVVHHCFMGNHFPCLLILLSSGRP